MDSAPKLWFCDVVESVGMFVVVMEFVEGRRVDDDKPHLPEKVLEPLQGAISALHDVGLVHGDLRGPNVIVSEGSGGKRTMLLDFDWGGKEGDVFYPADITANCKTVENFEIIFVCAFVYINIQNWKAMTQSPPSAPPVSTCSR